MEINVSAWLINPNVWFIVGLLIVGLGMAVDLLDVSIVLGTSAIILSLLIAFLPDWFPSWVAVFFAYFAISLSIFALLLRFRRKINNDNFDINDD